MTAKQKLATETNWRKVLIRGGVGNLGRVAHVLGRVDLVNQLDKLGAELELCNKEHFTAERRKL
jgi:hypothetical protein